jgi:hypothetical protein
MLHQRGSIGILGIVLLVAALLVLPGATEVSTAVSSATNSNPCSYLSVAQINGELGIKTQPTVKRTTGGFASDPVLVCTYTWGSNSLIVRLISAETESESGGTHEPGMGAHGLLIAASTYTQVAFIKAGWSVWLIAKPPVNTHGLVVLGQTIYPKVRAATTTS